jgi:hypothetical protein
MPGAAHGASTIRTRPRRASAASGRAGKEVHVPTLERRRGLTLALGSQPAFDEKERADDILARKLALIWVHHTTLRPPRGLTSSQQKNASLPALIPFFPPPGWRPRAPKAGARAHRTAYALFSMAWADARRAGWPLSNVHLGAPSACWEQYRAGEQQPWKELELGDVEKFDEACRASQAWRGRALPLEEEDERTPELALLSPASPSPPPQVAPWAKAYQPSGAEAAPPLNRYGGAWPDAGAAVSDIAMNFRSLSFEGSTASLPVGLSYPWTSGSLAAGSPPPDPTGRYKVVDPKDVRLGQAGPGPCSSTSRETRPLPKKPRRDGPSSMPTPPFTPLRSSPLSQVQTFLADVPPMDGEGEDPLVGLFDDLGASFLEDMNALSWDGMFEGLDELLAPGMPDVLIEGAASMPTPPPDDPQPMERKKKRPAMDVDAPERELLGNPPPGYIPPWMSADPSRTDLRRARPPSPSLADPIDWAQIHDEQARSSPICKS